MASGVGVTFGIFDQKRIRVVMTILFLIFGSPDPLLATPRSSDLVSSIAEYTRRHARTDPYPNEACT